MSKTTTRSKKVKTVPSPDPLSSVEKKTEEILKQADTVIAPTGPPEAPILPPPQGTVAPLIIRTPEQLAKVPDDAKPRLVDPLGNAFPQWVQVANLFHRPHKKVAIVGFADTRNQAPYNDPTFEIWGLNDLHSHIPRYDRWFDIHTRENIDTDVIAGRTAAKARSANYVEPPWEKMGLQGLSRLNVPVYMQEAWPDIPNAVKFPEKEMRREFGDYFTNSISFMLALAIFEGYEEIHVYGVDMAVGTEYVRERPSVEYFLGIAAGKGIKVYIPPASDLLKSRFVYGFQEKIQNDYNAKLATMTASMQQRHRDSCQQEQIAHDARMQYEGAIGAIREIDKIWSNLHDKL